MTKTVRARHTLEFKQEAVRPVHGGQSIAAEAMALGVVDKRCSTGSKLTGRASSREPIARP
ncbi:hypothetical protein J2W30_006247 [Variovorax boronicumulans]|nr:hypothetical protein [Variovorax boronicumulans]